MVARWRTLLATLVGLFVLVGATTTTASAATFAHDVVVIVRADVHEPSAREGSQAQFNEAQKTSASRSVGVQRTSTTPRRSVVATEALPAGSPGRVVANALEPHELAQAQSVVGYRGGTFVGNSTRGAPGIDGMLDGVPASLKTYSGSSPAGVLRHVSQAEASASKAGYSGVQVYVDAPGVSRSTLVYFGANGPLSQIPTQGTVSTIYVQTADGWVVFPG